SQESEHEAHKLPLCNQLADLTKRELEVLNYLCEGCSNQEISEKLFISLITVKVHLKHIYRKLGVKNRSQAIILCKNSMDAM
ncbi:MAG: helix-turn-helix transcriptional regulator, partial [Bacillus sp. (in: Bacteria)]|nr:helix-turn-helix transcriptional regulator [Bacillus sp. (in: firmicutes)]